MSSNIVYIYLKMISNLQKIYMDGINFFFPDLFESNMPTQWSITQEYLVCNSYEKDTFSYITTIQPSKSGNK